MTQLISNTLFLTKAKLAVLVHGLIKTQPGYGLTQVKQGSTIINVLYLYDQAGNPRWALGSGASSETPTAMNVF